MKILILFFSIFVSALSFSQVEVQIIPQVHRLAEDGNLPVEVMSSQYSVLQQIVEAYLEDERVAVFSEGLSKDIDNTYLSNDLLNSIRSKIDIDTILKKDFGRLSKQQLKLLNNYSGVELALALLDNLTVRKTITESQRYKLDLQIDFYLNEGISFDQLMSEYPEFHKLVVDEREKLAKEQILEFISDNNQFTGQPLLLVYGQGHTFDRQNDFEIKFRKLMPGEGSCFRAISILMKH